MLQDLARFRTDAEISMCFCIEDCSILGQHIGGRQREQPALIAVHKWNVDQDAAEVFLVERRNFIGNSEVLRDIAVRRSEEREGNSMLTGGEVALACCLG